MAIAIVNNFQPHVGIGKYAFNLLDYYNKEKRDVKMIYLESKDNPLPQMENVIKVRQGINLPLMNKTFSWYYYFPGKIPEGYDLYHLSVGFLSKIAKKRKPCVVTHMDIAPLKPELNYPFHFRYLTRKAFSYYKYASQILTISPQAKTELAGLGIVPEDMIHAIPLGFDPRFYKPHDKNKARKELNLPEDKKIILNVGSEETRKNIPTLLKALHELKKSNDFLFIKIGRTEAKNDELKSGLEIMHMDKIGEELMPLYYSAADVFVFPATYEGGFAYPPLEAMACGVPTIVGKELVLFRGGSEVLENPFDHKALSEMIASVISSPAKMKSMSRRALKDSKNFTLEKEAEATYRVYEKALS